MRRTLHTCAQRYKEKRKTPKSKDHVHGITHKEADTRANLKGDEHAHADTRGRNKEQPNEVRACRSPTRKYRALDWVAQILD